MAPPMLKYPATILLILLVTFQTFSKWFLILEYQVNRDFIAKNLCINRVSREGVSCCAGKCYLNKKLANDESAQQIPGKGGQRDETVLQVTHLANPLPQPLITSTLIVHSTRYCGHPSQEYILSFFPPPRPASAPTFIA
jgi:hypothetical protein